MSEDKREFTYHRPPLPSQMDKTSGMPPYTGPSGLWKEPSKPAEALSHTALDFAQRETEAIMDTPEWKNGTHPSQLGTERIVEEVLGKGADENPEREQRRFAKIGGEALETLVGLGGLYSKGAAKDVPTKATPTTDAPLDFIVGPKTESKERGV